MRRTFSPWLLSSRVEVIYKIHLFSEYLFEVGLLNSIFFPPRLFLFSVMVRRFVFILMNVYHYYSWMRTACSHDLLRRAVHVSHHFVVLIRCCGYYSNMSTGIRFRPAEVLENGAVYVNNGFATQRPAPRQSEYLHGDRKIEGRAQKGRMTWTTH